MDLSILVAKIFTLYILAIGVGMLIGKLNISNIAGDLKESRGLALIAGFVTLVLGALLVQYHNIWVKDWTVLITILGWAMLVKGFLLIAYPAYLSNLRGLYKNMKSSFGIVLIAVGLVLGYFLFVA